MRLDFAFKTFRWTAGLIGTMLFLGGGAAADEELRIAEEPHQVWDLPVGIPKEIEHWTYRGPEAYWVNENVLFLNGVLRGSSDTSPGILRVDVKRRTVTKVFDARLLCAKDYRGRAIIEIPAPNPENLSPQYTAHRNPADIYPTPLDAWRFLRYATFTESGTFEVLPEPLELLDMSPQELQRKSARSIAIDACLYFPGDDPYKNITRERVPTGPGLIINPTPYKRAGHDYYLKRGGAPIKLPPVLNNTRQYLPWFKAIWGVNSQGNATRQHDIILTDENGESRVIVLPKNIPDYRGYPSYGIPTPAGVLFHLAPSSPEAGTGLYLQKVGGDWSRIFRFEEDLLIHDQWATKNFSPSGCQWLFLRLKGKYSVATKLAPIKEINEQFGVLSLCSAD